MANKMIFNISFFIASIGFYFMVLNFLVIEIGESEVSGIFLKLPFKELNKGDYILFKNPRLDLNPKDFIFKHIDKINKDNLYVRGIHKRALDSRYFGWINKKEVIEKRVLLIAFSNRRNINE